MKIHVLKIDQHYLDNLIAGKKKSEIRFNDRDYQVGDVLRFYDNRIDGYYSYKITHIHSGLGMQEGYVVLSLYYEDRS